MATARLVANESVRAGRLVVLCAGSHLRTPKRDAEIHLAEGLARHATVLYVDPPVSHLAPRRRPELASSLERPRLRVVGPGLVHLTPVALPRPWSPGVAWSTELLVRSALRRAARRLGRSPAVVISTWQLLDVGAAFPTARQVYWWTDDPMAAAGMWGLDGERLAAGDRRTTARADLVVSVSAAHAEALRSRGVDARFLPNGCDVESMAATDRVPPAPDADLPPPVARL